MSKTYQKPNRRFENSGLVIPNQSFHVNLDNVTNTDNEDIRTMVDKGRYFTIFAPRQSGKTTFFYDFCRSIENDSLYITILLSFQSYQNISSQRFYELIYTSIKEQILNRLESLQCNDLKQVMAFMNDFSITDHTSFYMLFKNINEIITHKKIVIFIDEFDGIPMSELGNFLMVLRDLYQNYKHTPKKVLYSVGLVGIRNITKLVVGGVSPFNIADQIHLPPFSLKNVYDLYAQYTMETNQAFAEAAVQEVYDQTCGQPWLVNRLGTILTVNIKHQTRESITLEDVNEAIKVLLKENNAHFENLYEKILLYKETFSAILTQDIPYSPYDKGQSWLRQYGLIKEVNNKAVIANPIYKKYFSQIIETNPMLSEKQEKKIFISYSRDDKEWVKRLLIHLKALSFKGVQIWYDDDIRSGDDWSAEIQNAIETAQMTICLISKHFLASDYIQKREIPEILFRHKEGMTVIPIYLSPCVWKYEKWLKNIQMFPKDAVPLSKKAHDIQEDVFTEIVDEIFGILGLD
ncbi:protein containing ATPase domain, prokaryote [Candidatus Magnetomorum sp. HK-1]|nr:protein containing ATPase domain, prokaryote [Candidatus Magnetomorum sp. HK-1]